MDDLNVKIQEAIKANLPAQIGDALKAELEVLTKFRAAEPLVAETRQRLERELKEAKAGVEVLKADLAKHVILADREAKVTERERQQNFSDLKVQLADDRRREMLELVGVVFRSPVYQTTVNGSVPVVVPASPPSYQGGSPTSAFVSHAPMNQTTTTQQV